MDERLISRLALARELGIEAQTIAKWERQGWFPQPTLLVSDRLILYDRDAVDHALRARHLKTSTRLAAIRRAR